MCYYVFILIMSAMTVFSVCSMEEKNLGDQLSSDKKSPKKLNFGDLPSELKREIISNESFNLLIQNANQKLVIKNVWDNIEEKNKAPIWSQNYLTVTLPDDLEKLNNEWCVFSNSFDKNKKRFEAMNGEMQGAFFEVQDTDNEKEEKIGPKIIAYGRDHFLYDGYFSNTLDAKKNGVIFIINDLNKVNSRSDVFIFSPQNSPSAHDKRDQPLVHKIIPLMHNICLKDPVLSCAALPKKNIYAYVTQQELTIIKNNQNQKFPILLLNDSFVKLVFLTEYTMLGLTRDGLLYSIGLPKAENVKSHDTSREEIKWNDKKYVRLYIRTKLGLSLALQSFSEYVGVLENFAVDPETPNRFAFVFRDTTCKDTCFPYSQCKECKFKFDETRIIYYGRLPDCLIAPAFSVYKPVDNIWINNGNNIAVTQHDKYSNCKIILYDSRVCYLNNVAERWKIFNQKSLGDLTAFGKLKDLYLQKKNKLEKKNKNLKTINAKLNTQNAKLSTQNAKLSTQIGTLKNQVSYYKNNQKKLFIGGIAVLLVGGIVGYKLTKRDSSGSNISGNMPDIKEYIHLCSNSNPIDTTAANIGIQQAGIGSFIAAVAKSVISIFKFW